MNIQSLVLFLSFKYYRRSELKLDLKPEPRLFSGSNQKGRLRLHNTTSPRDGRSDFVASVARIYPGGHWDGYGECCGGLGLSQICDSTYSQYAIRKQLATHDNFLASQYCRVVAKCRERPALQTETVDFHR